MKKLIIFSLSIIFTLSFLSKFHPVQKTYAAKCPGTCVKDLKFCTDNNSKGTLGDCPDVNYNFCCEGIIVGVSRPDNIKITDMGKLIGALISAIFVIAGLISFAFLVWGGIQWITSGGDKAGVEAAQKRIQAALIGLIIVIASWAIMSLVARFLGIDIFNLNFQTPF